MDVPVIGVHMTFEEAARETLRYLREHVPMAMWAVTRVENGRQTYLYLDDNELGLTEGGSHPWEASFCIHMASGAAPAVAPDAGLVPQYAAAAAAMGGVAGAYAGAPIREADGRLFGAVCGVRTEATDDPRLVGAGPVMQLLGQLLSMVLAMDRQRDESARLIAAAELAAETDLLTGLHNRRAWERMLVEQEQRFRRLADPTVLAMLDLDMLKTVNDTQGHAAGDDYIRRAAQALRAAVPAGDVVARLGGDEFGVLMVGCEESAADGRVDEIYRVLEEAGVAGSVGWAPITVVRGLPAALAEADEAMYAAKRARRALRAGLPLPRADEGLLTTP